MSWRDMQAYRIKVREINRINHVNDWAEICNPNTGGQCETGIRSQLLFSVQSIGQVVFFIPTLRLMCAVGGFIQNQSARDLWNPSR